MLTKFILLVSLMAAATASDVTQEKSAAELEAIQGVNLYLLNAGLELKPFDGNDRLSEQQLHQMEEIKWKLDRVRQEIESLDGNELLEMTSLCDTYRALLGDKTDVGPLVAFLDSLTRADCDQVSLDFLMIVANYNQNESVAKEGQDHLLVQNYAKLRVQQCWMRFVDSVPRRLDRALGKMGAPLFGFMDKLALRMQMGPQKKAPRRSDKAIHIDGNPHEEKLPDFSDVSSSIDLEASDQARVITGALKDIQVSTHAQQSNFVDALGALQGDYRNSLDYEDRLESLSLRLKGFYDELLRQPCAELIGRVRAIAAEGNIFKGHISRSLSKTLAEEKERNTRFDYLLQVYRICSLTNEHHSQIESIISMYRH